MPALKLGSTIGWAILARRQYFDDLGKGFRDKGSEIPVAPIVGLIVVFLMISLGLWAFSRWNAARERSDYCNFRQLFAQLCRLHGIDWPSRRLLGQLAKMHGLSHPAELFLMPERFDVQSLSPEMQPSSSRILELKEQIFSDRVFG